MNFSENLSNSPIKIFYRTVSARKIITGQESLKTRYGTGLLNELVVKEGDLLDENIKVTFLPYKDKLYFKTNERLLVNRIIELIQFKLDKLTSSGTCIKPLYSRPKGYKSVSGNGNDEIYIFDAKDIIYSKKVSFPYYLYTKHGNGSTMGEAIPILARRIRVRIHENVYSEFKPGNITINEVIELTKARYEEYKPAIYNLKWGIVSVKETSQPARGKFKRTLKNIEFKLVDLLMSKSFLPVHVSKNIILAENVVIYTTTQRATFKKGTSINILWDKWTPRCPDTDCECGKKLLNLCIMDPNKILTAKDKLPSAKGLVTNQRVVIEWSSKDVLCFDNNTSLDHILWSIRRLRRANDPFRYNHKFINSKFKQVLPDVIIDDRDFLFKEDVSKNILIRYAPDTMPFFIERGTTKNNANELYLKYIDQIKKQKTKNYCKAHIWKNEASKKGKCKTGYN